ncbi:MAG: hypothetical protein ACC645_26375, partial [Pirellulales bacterium]
MKRHGVSLIECMFAIGVAAVGLLGVLAVVPLGLYQVGKGNVADRSMRTGLNAVEQFDLRGMRRPDNWLYASQGPTAAPVGVLAVSAPGQYAWPYVPSQLSFCID